MVAERYPVRVKEGHVLGHAEAVEVMQLPAEASEQEAGVTFYLFWQEVE